MAREPDERVLVEYLCGELAEPEQSAFEELCFTDESFYEQLSVVENDLIDRYLQNMLSESERKNFEEKYLITPGRRKRVKELEKLIGLIINHRTDSPKVSWWKSLLLFPNHRNMFLPVSLAAALVLLMLGCLWLIRDTARLGQQVEQTQTLPWEKEIELQRQNEEQRKTAEQLQEDLRNEQAAREHDAPLISEIQERTQRAQAISQSNQRRSSPVPASVATYVFPLVSVRGIQSQKQLVIKLGQKSARLTIYLKNNSYKEYRVSIQRVSGKEVWSRVVHKGQSMSVGERVSFELSVSVFRNKDYILMVDAVKPDGTIENFDTRSFSVLNENVRRS